MKKKLLAVLLAASMIASLTACGGKTDEPAKDDSQQAAADDASSDDKSSDASESDAAGTEDGASSEGDAASSDDPWANVDTSEHVVITYMTTGDTLGSDWSSDVCSSDLQN